MFKIISIGEGLGDCFIIKVGLDENPVHILVDGRYGNKKNVSKIKNYLGEGNVFDFIVVTHCDSDHIKGVVKLLKQGTCIDENTKFIYNFVTKPVNNSISYGDAEELEKIIKNYCVINTCSRDYKNLSNKLYIMSIKDRNNFDINVYNDLKPVLTLLSPDIQGINDVYIDFMNWKEKDKDANREKINKNSIAFLLEYKGKRALFTGDAYFEDIKEILDTFKDFSDKKIDLIKVPHHGASKNCKGMVDYAIVHDCDRFLLTGEKEWVKNKKHPGKDILEEIINRYEDKKITLYTNINFDFTSTPELLPINKMIQN